jgi:energy-coupling factor transporter ATP-binding protein EcfA2
MTDNILKIGRSERGLLTGQTGSGKSTLAKYLIRAIPNLLIIDPKHEFDPGREHRIVTDLDKLSGRRDDCLLYRPSAIEMEPESYDRLFAWVYKRRSTFVYIDELTAVTRSPLSYPIWLRALYVQGRSLGIGILAATQRPTMIPLYCMSEAKKFWSFYLLLAADRRRMAEWMGDIVEEPPGENYGFYYKNTGARNPTREYVLKIKGGE